MAQVVVNNLDPLLIAKLTSRSQRHNQSLNDELIPILEDAVQTEDVDKKASTLEAEQKLARARAKYSGRSFAFQFQAYPRGSRLTRFVVDASVAIKWVVPEIYFEAAGRLLGRNYPSSVTFRV